jgi:hypothetical protein
VTSCARAGGWHVRRTPSQTTAHVARRTARRASSGPRRSAAQPPAPRTHHAAWASVRPRRGGGRERLCAHRAGARQATPWRVSRRHAAQADGLVQRRLLHVRPVLRPCHPALLVAAHRSARRRRVSAREAQRGQRSSGCALFSARRLRLRRVRPVHAKRANRRDTQAAQPRRARRCAGWHAAQRGLARGTHARRARRRVTGVRGRAAAWLQRNA